MDWTKLAQRDDGILRIEVENASLGFDFFLMNPLDRVSFHVKYRSLSRLENHQMASVSSNPTMAYTMFPLSITYHVDKTEDKCSTSMNSDMYRGQFPHWLYVFVRQTSFIIVVAKF